MRLPIYLDYNATTPVAPEVADAIEPFLRQQFGNPSSSHRYGRQAREAVERARAQVAALIGADPSEVLFTGCTTEANNLAVLGAARALRGKRRHIITSAIEHPVVMQPCLRLREDGWDVTIVPVDSAARVNADAVLGALGADTALVTIMHANNEVGTLQEVAAIAEMAHAHGALMHTDAAQSVGKIPVDVDALGVDLLTIAGHKEYRLPNTLNVSFPGVSGRELLHAVEADVAASVGSACHDDNDTVSGVLASMGATIDRALGAVRLSVGVPTAEDEVRHAASALASAWRGLSKRQ